MPVSQPSLFALTVTALHSGHYQLNVTDSPGGRASAEIASPFNFADLVKLSDALEGRAGLSAGDRETAAHTFGETLFKAVFTGAIGDAYTKSRQQVGDGGLAIRVDLGRAGLLSSVPWELLRDPAVGPLRVTAVDDFRAPRAVGGIREAVLRPRTALIAAMVIVLIAGAALTVLKPPSNVDLIIKSIRFFPPQPVPGQIIKIAVTIQNTGTSDAGAFKWRWYKGGIEAGSPDLSGNVQGLPAGASYTTSQEFIFGWWGKYNTTGWVNFDRAQSETNFDNDFSLPEQGQVTTADDPFVINWTQLPDTTLLAAAQDFKGTEFQSWGITIKVDPTSNPACTLAVPHLNVNSDTNINQLTTGLPGKPDQCAALPLQFKVNHPIGSASIDFVPINSGDYKLTVFDSTGTKVIGSAMLNGISTGAETTITVPDNNTSMDMSNINAVQIELTGACTPITRCGAIIQTLTLTEANH